MRARVLIVPVLLLVAFAGARLGSGGGGIQAWAERSARLAALEERAQEAEEGPLSPVGDWLQAQRAGETGVVTSRAYARALRQGAAVRDATAELDPALADATWEHLWPTNIGGRVAEIALDPATADVVYIATASGGVWKSTDGALSWSYAWDPALTQSMGAIAVASDGTIFAGTGEPNPGGGSIVWGGTGLYRSSDGGATWEPIGLEDSGAIGRIVIDPADPQRIFVAAAGSLFVPGGERGLYRSTDGGDTWELVLAGENDTTGAADVAVDPEDPNNLLVGMWDHVRLPTHRVYAGVGSGVFRSTDGGETWEEATLPGNVAPHEVGRIGVAFAASNPDRAYAIVANKLDGNGVGLWRSDDGGANWERTGAATGALSQSSYGWWFGKVWVDPGDANRVFVAGLELVESTDGGNSFRAHGNSTAGVLTGEHHVNVHADQHGMAWDPNTDGRVYVANDGGVYRSDLNGEIGTWLNSPAQGWTQHYSVDVAEDNPDRIITGLQDNMCQITAPAGGSATWHKVGLCGDGLQTLINPVDPTWTYACAQYGSCGVQRAEVPHPQRPGQLVGAKAPGTRYGWLTPLEFDPSDPNVMYFGSNVVSRSTNNGITFTAISEDLTTDPEQLDPNDGYRIFGTITTLAAAKSDPSVLYVGTDDGLLWRTSNQGGDWTLLTDVDEDGEGPDESEKNGLPNEWVTRVTIDPADANVVYATFSTFRKGDLSPHVVKSTDGGATWTGISGDLPDAPVNDVVLLPDGDLAVATDVGVFLSSDDGATWLAVGSNLPAVPVLDLRYHQATNTITAATFGHGIQRVTLP